MQKLSLIRDHSQQILQDVQSVADEFGLNPLNKTLTSIRTFASQNQYLDVAVLGQFKSGKSTFLNSLIGRPLLPVGSIPVTSVITRIRYGPKEQATVTFEDGTCQQIGIAYMNSYVSESGNPENIKGVLLVDIETPALGRFKNLRLVDTPGIGSVWKHNTETTASWFPETGGVLFLFSAERPISENEVELLKEIYQYTPEITIVLTKVDLFSEEKIREIELFTAKVLRKTFDQDFPILRYSAFTDTVEYNSDIEKRCLNPLAHNRNRVFARILQHKISSLVDSCLSYLDISYQVSLQQEAERSKLKEIILDRHLNSHYIRRELLLIIGSYKGNTRESLRSYLQPFKTGITDRLKDEYQAAFDSWKGNLYYVSRQFERWLNQSLEAELKEILLKEEKSFELLNAVNKHLSFYLKSFRERLNDNLARVLGVEMKSEQWEITVGEYRKPSITISRSFEFHLDMLWFLFPMFIFRGVFRNYFLKKIPLEVEKNLHRLTSLLTEQVNKRMDDLMKQSMVYINEELNMIETLLVETRGDSSYIKERMDGLRNTVRTFQDFDS